MLDEEGQRWASWGKSETGHGRGQTITRSIEDDIQTEEYRGYRDYLY